jgi:DNA-directed RNA polymerase sigma subunit (sigma70/sigma32)
LAEQSRIVRLPLNKIGSINKINKMYALLEQSNERPPSAEKLQKELDMTVNDVKESMKTLVVTYQWMPLVEEKILTFMTYCVLVNL